MEIRHFDYQKVPQLSTKDHDYISLKEYLKDYYSYEPTLTSFDKVIKDRKDASVDRKLLHSTVKLRYDDFQATSLQKEHMEALLSENTFTVTTAHQPSLLGGPLYYILKICSVVNLSRQLNARYDDVKVIPVFISGSEDHDFDEIDHFNIYGKEVKWEKDAKGPVGRLTTDGLEQVIDQTSDILGDSANADDLRDILTNSLAAAKDYNDFVFQFVNSLFGDTGLLVINMDNEDLKRNFIPVLRKEIIERPSQSIILRTQEALSANGFKAQAHPRDINLFYLGTGDRLRVTFEDGMYQIVGSNRTFSEEEILKELNENPQNFSPNVVIRPLYQEYTLPNLAYIGGGGEIAYWLERKKQFEAFGIFYPMLIRRNSAVILNKGNQKQIANLDLSIDDFFQHEDAIVSQYLLDHVEEEITISAELSEIEGAFESIARKAKTHDPTLSKAILAEMTKQLKNVDNLGGRIKRAVKSREEVNVNKIKKVKDKLFPNDGLQERKDNFMQYYAAYGPPLFDFLIDNLDPLDRRFAIIME